MCTLSTLVKLSPCLVINKFLRILYLDFRILILNLNNNFVDVQVSINIRPHTLQLFV